MRFGFWPDSLHETAEQKKRLARGLLADNTPLSIDVDKQSGVFLGPAGSQYYARLTSCTCKDFEKRGKPCKHIYRVATELGFTGCVAHSGIPGRQFDAGLLQLSPAGVDMLGQVVAAYQSGSGGVVFLRGADALALVRGGYCEDAGGPVAVDCARFTVAIIKQLYAQCGLPFKAMKKAEVVNRLADFEQENPDVLLPYVVRLALTEQAAEDIERLAKYLRNGFSSIVPTDAAPAQVQSTAAPKKAKKLKPPPAHWPTDPAAAVRSSTTGNVIIMALALIVFALFRTVVVGVLVAAVCAYTAYCIFDEHRHPEKAAARAVAFNEKLDADIAAGKYSASTKKQQ